MAKLSWSQFTGGLSVSPRLGGKGSYYKGEGVSIDYSDDVGVLENGGTWEKVADGNDDGISVGGDDFALYSQWVITGNGNGSVTIGSITYGDVYDTIATDAGSGDPNQGMAVLHEADGNDYLFYGYDYKDSHEQIGRAKLSNYSFDNDDNNPTYLMDSCSANFFDSNNLVVHNQKLFFPYTKGGVSCYDGMDSSYTATALDLQATPNYLGVFGEYLVIALGSRHKNALYLWDTISDSWNYKIEFKQMIRGITTFKGELYVLTVDSSQNTFVINLVDSNLNSYRQVRSFTTSANLLANGQGSNSFQSSSDGIYIQLQKLDTTNDQWTFYTYRFGEKNLGNSILTIQNKKIIGFNEATVGDPYGNDFHIRKTGYGSGNKYLAVDTGDDREVYEFNEDESGDNADFETREIDLEQTNTNYNKGQLQSVAIFYKDSSSSNTTVKALLDDEDQTVTLCSSASFPASDSMKVLSASKEEFTSMRVKVQGKLPGITKIEARYNPMEYYG